MKSQNSPIFIYLDQNKWIELARGIKSNEKKYTDLYKKMLLNVQNGVWAFPLSIIHVSETIKRKNEESRTNLLDLMYSVSKGCSIADYTSANIFEFNYWVSHKTFDIKEIRDQVISFDLAKIIGLSLDDLNIKIKGNENVTAEQVTHIKNIIKKHSCDKEIFKMICEHESSINKDEEFFYNGLITAREEFKLWRKEIEKSSEFKEKHVYPAYLIKRFFAEYGQIINKLPDSNKQIIKSNFDNNKKNKQQMIALLETLPGFNIENRLVYELLSNQNKKVHKHDFFDLAFLRVAVPYCDIVIAEKYWIDRVQNYKLDSKYNTITTTKLSYLENMK